MARHYGHRLLDWQSAHCHSNDFYWRISQDDQDEVSTSYLRCCVCLPYSFRRRFGETLPIVDNILRVTPFETMQRHLRNISDYSLYKKLHGTLPAAVLASLKQRVREGEPKAIQELWQSRDKTFLAIDFEWSERNPSSCLEWGYSAVRCGHLEA